LSPLILDFCIFSIVSQHFDSWLIRIEMECNKQALVAQWKGVCFKHESAHSRPIRCDFCSITLDCRSSHCFTTLSSFHDWLIDSLIDW
jgi:hypothetical protein